MSDTFPEGFRWGVATAAHQIEGGNVNNDWWAWEHAPGSPCEEPSVDACDSWNRWEEDVELVASLGLDNYRFTVEWSRLEPEPGVWSHATVERYRRWCTALRERGIEPILTLHHFSSPRWLAARGGWADPATADAFVAHARRVAEAFGDVAGRFVTFNEPNIVAFMGHRFGMFPPGRQDREEYRRAIDVFTDAHRRGVEAIRTAAPGIPVGQTVSMSDYQAVDGGEAYRARVRSHMEDPYLEASVGDDFLGIQAYSRDRLGPDGNLGPEPGVPVLVMGYEYWPQCMGGTLRRAWEVTGGAVPLWVTENGIGTDDDAQRIDYLTESLRTVKGVVDDGIDVLGYSCWSLLDNFEWVFGYRPRFGLVEVDRTTFERRRKPSADWFADVARTNRVP